jgi:hypothetical protein
MVPSNNGDDATRGGTEMSVSAAATGDDVATADNARPADDGAKTDGDD